jgi:Mrp family chromosome partitioning ATPase
MVLDHTPQTTGSPAATGADRMRRFSRRCNVYTTLIARCFGSVDPLRVIAFTSALPGEGVSWTVSHLAEEIERTTGLRPMRVSAADLFTTADSARDHQRGKAPENEREAAMVAALADLRSGTEVVLIDAGSIIGDGSIIRLSRRVDAVVLVVEAGRTSRREVKRAISDISLAQGIIAGCILNKSRTVLPRWLERLFG